ncbi:hypothetical protein FB565_004461 [Actinoplanes lutulentus]|uniref:Uncharacterized protein n=1 Tax=Actinoplanes lutulentus TaxID=1287878 RepID=A0A327ZEY5_9ACTN|nr:hypothetical protein [Actinoplanes lutulentus]RAK35477.1 hypothetical protein B0I29_110233 [Actinoplanes lutulentus]
MPWSRGPDVHAPALPAAGPGAPKPKPPHRHSPPAAVPQRSARRRLPPVAGCRRLPVAAACRLPPLAAARPPHGATASRPHSPPLADVRPPAAARVSPPLADARRRLPPAFAAACRCSPAGRRPLAAVGRPPLSASQGDPPKADTERPQHRPRVELGSEPHPKSTHTPRFVCRVDFGFDMRLDSTRTGDGTRGVLPLAPPSEVKPGPWTSRSSNRSSDSGSVSGLRLVDASCRPGRSSQPS